MNTGTRTVPFDMTEVKANFIFLIFLDFFLCHGFLFSVSTVLLPHQKKGWISNLLLFDGMEQKTGLCFIKHILRMMLAAMHCCYETSRFEFEDKFKVSLTDFSFRRDRFVRPSSTKTSDKYFASTYG